MTSFSTILFLGLFCVLSFEVDAGTITGYIKNDKNGSAIPGADVVLKGTNYGTNADNSGFYKIENVPAGKYKIKVEAIGFKNSSETIEIKKISSVIRIDFTLDEEAIQLSEVVIRARANKELETSARTTEKDAGNVVNVISAQA
ncbi:MAG: carboxypeptidase-like regulatory domain-containing protein, partial [Ignavibacteriaceae bacterium]|nr:carboxypeptidase-like regulatory domain-containing protein [Ignavibacteriaceae bacterium]